MSRRGIIVLAAAAATAAFLPALPAAAAPPVQLSGAIFTTDVTGVPVNLNIYSAKEDVYLNGGPGINAPDSAAGLPAGTYAFQVTDPSGKTLLSTDAVSCRQFTVNSSGVIEGVVVTGCEHSVGADGEDGGATVQLFPSDVTYLRMTVAELTASGLPAIMIPLPHAVGGHQAANADVLARAGAVVAVPDGELDGPRLGLAGRATRLHDARQQELLRAEVQQDGQLQGRERPDRRDRQPVLDSWPVGAGRRQGRHLDRHERCGEHQVVRVQPGHAGLSRGTRRGCGAG